jgi:hypothetical protein
MAKAGHLENGWNWLELPVGLNDHMNVAGADNLDSG